MERDVFIMLKTKLDDKTNLTLFQFAFIWHSTAWHRNQIWGFAFLISRWLITPYTSSYIYPSTGLEMRNDMVVTVE